MMNESTPTSGDADSINTFDEWTSDECSTGENSCEMNDHDENEERPYIPGCFEGPEKTLEVCFNPGTGGIQGCRSFSRSDLDDICKMARCTILSKISNAYLDAYVLSESSLFVYSHKIVIKTCGTTTLLRCIKNVLKFAKQQGLELEWLGYSRKNYTFPGDQSFPHSNFDQELGYINSHSHLSERLDGSGYVLGPVTGDHWFVYVADKCDRPSYLSTDRVLNIMMFDMDKSCAEMFYKETCASGKEMTEKTGISSLVPGAIIDDCAFDPCGYSMNAILFDSYTTMHVTPEEQCSYASFETNQSLRSYKSLIKNVLSIFKPRRFVITMWADEAGLFALEDNPCDAKDISIPSKGRYVRTAMSSTKVEGDTCCYMSNWNLEMIAKQNSKFRNYIPEAFGKRSRENTFT
mmetsp:Transcript_439/g.579  ORF Transcript_439/g.579 Transcript_439/m.579 type:complete len:406 (+) Transcript_439:314-1531(+)|eukprot:CAMPEP_0117759308 /NCGR_PEP_ID=MMETSP0947-20121206/15938_1 /TAXON_ID=44440 /ORGANISM="Chattonella subsalsa, Strain CCMP2191" /LENGTH=405 /DNA_ID=CAMNT_0005579745 /DNA_START=216 /DNA_END=1433 /DNA_ORIENTATION=+